MFTLIIEDKHGAIVDEYSFEDGEFIIGRSQQADIVLPADNVSRRHARLFTVDGRCFIEDLKAANGIWLNGKRIYNVTELPRSAQVRVGDFFLHIEGAAYARPLGSAVYARLVPMPGSIGELTELSQSTVLIGRGKDCAVVLSDVSVSRIHAKITQDPNGRVVVEDLRSSNGTYVNDRRVDQQDLQHGDRLRFGTVAFTFQVDGMPEIVEAEPAYPAPRPTSRPQPAYQPPPPQPAYQPPPSQYNAYAQEPPISEVHAAYPPQRSLLPQIAAVFVIVLAVAGLVVLVMFAYDRWVRPSFPTTVQAPTAATAAAPAQPPAKTADPAAALKVQVDEAMAKGQDAITRKQWDEADRHLLQAFQLDSMRPGLEALRQKVRDEKRAGATYAMAEAAFAKKDYATAITQHRLIRQNSVYRADSDAALESIAQILEMDGDAACANKDWNRCQEAYGLALRTQAASPAVEQKFAKVLKQQR